MPQAIASGIIGILGFFAMSETYAPRVLQNKLRKAKVARPSGELYTVLDLTLQHTGVRHFLNQFARPGNSIYISYPCIGIDLLC
jgi:hypothetical protein